MPSLEVTLPSLHDGGQREIGLCDAQYIVVNTGRRWGKTMLGVWLCTQAALRGRRAWWVCPTYKVGKVGWRPLYNWSLKIPGTFRRKFDRTIYYPGGGWVQVRSADDPESLRGEGLDLVVIDEAAHIKKFDEVWEQSLTPALTDRKGKALFISTPKGYNHFFELFERAKKDSDWAAFQHPSHDNPFLDKAHIEKQRKQLPQLVFRQEYMAEFVQLAGAIIKRDWFGVVDRAPEGIRWVRFWDLAASVKALADFTVGAEVGLHEDTLYIRDIVRGRWEWPDARKVVIQTAKLDGATVAIGLEEVAFQLAAVQELKREPALVAHHVKGVKPDKDKLARAMPWISRAEQGLVRLVNGPWIEAFLNEACAFPESEHDDQVDAVSGAVQMLGGPTWLVGFV